MRATALAVVFLLLSPLLVGCDGPPSLMPTPNLYANGLRDPFPDVPPELQTTRSRCFT
jgi:hypothetical protein